MLYVQDRMNHTLGVIDNYYNDTHSMILESGVSTYKFTIPKKEEGTEFLIRGNYIVLTDDKGQGWKFTIMSTDETHGSLDVECEDLGLELLNKVRNAWSSPGAAQPFKYYFDKAVRDTGWTLGINEISNLNRTLSWDGRDTALKRLLSICTQFDHAEIEFKVEFRNMAVVKQIVNVYKHRGADRSDTQLIYGDSVNDIHKTTEIRELATAIQGVGGVIQKDNPVEGEPEEHVDFSSLTYDDGEYFTPAGDPFLYARVANQQFNIKDTYLEDFYDYDTQGAQELLNRTLTQLKERCQPKVNYEVDLAKVDSSLSLGDTVPIIDHDYKPELLLSGRVLQLDKSYTDPSKNKAVFGNFLILYSNISDQLRALQEQMKAIKPQANYMWLRYAKDDKGNGMTSTPTADTRYFAMLVNKKTGVPSDNPKDYAGHWKLIQGNDGKDGIPGAKGEDGKTSYTHFAYANNVSGTEDFSLDDPTGRAYMGVFSDFTKADSTDPSKYVWSLTKGETGPEGMQGAQGPKGETGIPGAKGADGKTSYTHVAYADNATGGGFSQNPQGKAYMGWYSDFTTNDSTDPKKYAWSLIKGADGANGAPGKPGADGKTPYFHTAWADSKDGKMNFSLTDATNRGYLGTYTDFVQADSNDPAKYTWTELVGNIVTGAPNLIRNSSNPNGSIAYWTQQSGTLASTRKHNFHRNGQETLFTLSTSGTGEVMVKTNSFPVIKGKEYTFQLDGFMNPNCVGGDIFFMYKKYGSTKEYDAFINLKPGFKLSASAEEHFTHKFEAPAGADEAFIRIDNNGSKTNGQQSDFWFTNVKLAQENRPSPWQRAPEDIEDDANSINHPNLVYNAGFLGVNGTSMDGWTKQATNEAWAVMGDGVRSRSKGTFGVQIWGTTSLANHWYGLKSKSIPVGMSDTFSASVWIMKFSEDTTGTFPTAEMIWYDSKENILGKTGLTGEVMVVDKWIQFKAENKKPMANCTHVRFHFWHHIPPNVTGSHVIAGGFTQPMLNRGARVYNYHDNQGSGEAVTQVNQALIGVNTLINSVPKVNVQTTAPTSPKKGDQWWVTDASNKITSLKVWSGSAWVNSVIQQSLLNVVSLNAVTITGSTINGSKFTNNFDFKGTNGVHFQGVTTIANGKVDITWKIPENNQTGGTNISADGFESIIRNSSGAIIKSGRLSMGELAVSDGKITGTLNEQDAYRNSTKSVQWLGGWGDWGNGNGLISVTRNGRQISITGYPHHNGSTTLGNVCQLPAWAKPANTAGVNISATCYNSGVGNPTACKLFINKDGLVNISNAQKGGYVVIGQSYVGIDM